mmetsp:Transcript_5272/g.8680  ORF Transcript_5272/g.8680 Transcript_5272/m.8680 type:complete len:269 (+) Transcript_5272:29-835(+)
MGQCGICSQTPTDHDTSTHNSHSFQSQLNDTTTEKSEQFQATTNSAETFASSDARTYEELVNYRGKCAVFGYIREQPMDFVIPDDVITTIGRFYRPEVESITLRVNSHLAHFQEYHPSNVLTENQSEWYGSEAYARGTAGNDWIIFEYDDLYLPAQLAIVNDWDDSAIKTMRLSIGNGAEWIPLRAETKDAAQRYYGRTKLDRNAMFLPKTSDQQYVDLNIDDGIDISYIKVKQFKRIKLELVSNYGRQLSGQPKFVFYQFKVYGMRL